MVPFRSGFTSCLGDAGGVIFHGRCNSNESAFFTSIQCSGSLKDKVSNSDFKEK